MYMVWHVDKYKFTFKLVYIAIYCSFLRSLAARYNWCQGPVPGRGPAFEKHWYKPFALYSGG